VPQPASCTAAKRQLYSILVGAAKQWQRHCDAERIGGLEIQEHLKLRALLDWQLARPFAFENPAGIDAGQTVCICEAAAIARQGASRQTWERGGRDP
jgi:hypothetical protein